MSIFSRLFRTSAERQFQKILDEAHRKTEKELRPLSNLSLAIVKASMNCRDGIKDFIETPAEKERQQAEILAFFEFIYFFMHLSMREAFARMSEAEIKHLQEQLGPVIASTTIRSYFDHWPDNLKRRMTSDFYENLNRAEIEYAECSRFDSAALAKERSKEVAVRLFKSLGEQVASIIGHERDANYASRVAEVALKEFAPLNFAKLIEDFKRDSVELPRIPHRG
ncbi:MAG: hypothetical protein WAR24_16665 [Candidatus Acidiferrales bacterium]